MHGGPVLRSTATDPEIHHLSLTCCGHRRFPATWATETSGTGRPPSVTAGWQLLGRLGGRKPSRSPVDKALVALSRTLTRYSELRTNRAPRQTSGFRCNDGRLESFLCGATPRCCGTQLAEHCAIDRSYTALVDSVIKGSDEGVDLGVRQVTGMLLRGCHINHSHSRYWFRARIA